MMLQAELVWARPLLVINHFLSALAVIATDRFDRILLYLKIKFWNYVRFRDENATM